MWGVGGPIWGRGDVLSTEQNRDSQVWSINISPHFALFVHRPRFVPPAYFLSSLPSLFLAPGRYNIQPCAISDNLISQFYTGQMWCCSPVLPELVPANLQVSTFLVTDSPSISECAWFCIGCYHHVFWILSPVFSLLKGWWIREYSPLSWRLVRYKELISATGQLTTFSSPFHLKTKIGLVSRNALIFQSNRWLTTPENISNPKHQYHHQKLLQLTMSRSPTQATQTKATHLPVELTWRSACAGGM
jgi:hypothetical protein